MCTHVSLLNKSASGEKRMVEINPLIGEVSATHTSQECNKSENNHETVLDGEVTKPFFLDNGQLLRPFQRFVSLSK